MNPTLKILLATIGITLFNAHAIAEEAASGVPALHGTENMAHEEEEAANAAPSLQNKVERLKQLNPKQLAEEQKAMYEAMQKMTPQQREEMREEMREELEKMSPEERHALQDQAQSEEIKLLDKELAEHSADAPHATAASTPDQSAAPPQSAPTQNRQTDKRKAKK